MTTTDHSPDVAAFVAEVRDRLADLSLEDREELVDGLEADLADQLADGGSALPDPAAYAAELRAAAGLPAEPRRRLLAAPSGDWVGRDLDRSRDWWLGVVRSHPLGRRSWELASELRAVWWVLRGWAAVILLDQFTSGPQQVEVLPRFGFVGLGPLVVLVAVLASVLVGQGRLWPGAGPARRTSSRLTLLGLNVFAVVVLVGIAEQSSGGYDPADYVGVSSPTPGVSVDGRAVHNIYAYDVSGQPLSGVQLFDGAGRSISLSRDQAASAYDGAPGRVVGCPWVNGSQRLYNVFPLPEREQRSGTCRVSLDAKLGVGVLPSPPLSQVPPVTLPSAVAP